MRVVDPSECRGFVNCILALPERRCPEPTEHIPLRIQLLSALKIGEATLIHGESSRSLLAHRALKGRRFRIEQKGKTRNSLIVERLA